MAEDSTQTQVGTLSNVIRTDDERIQEHLGKIVRGSAEETLNAWLAFGLKYCGLMVEKDVRSVQFCRDHLQNYNWGVTYLPLLVTLEGIHDVLQLTLFKDPDVFSLDIDGNDYHVARRLLELGFRPKIVVVEYNSAFGPDIAVTIPYRADFDSKKAHPSALYYGASVKAWRKLLATSGYEFVTVESNGVNAFFVESDCFAQELVKSFRGLHFAENFAERRLRGTGWKNWYAEIEELPLVLC